MSVPVVVRSSSRVRRLAASSLAFAVGAVALVGHPQAAFAQSSATSRGPLLESPALPRTLTGDAETRARAILLAKDPSLAGIELRFLDAVPTGVRGAFTMVRFTQHAQGLPVIGKGARVMLTKTGAPTRLVTADVADDTRGLVVPATRNGASKAAIRASTYGNTTFSAADAGLVAYPLVDGTRVAWLFYRGVVPGTDRSPMVVVDAESGRLLGRVDAGHKAKKADIFVPNPVTAKNKTSPVLLDLPDGATTLQNELFVAKSCVDKGKVIDAGQGYTLHVCDFEAKAVADVNGDFPYKIPDGQENEDPFSEVSAFYHVTRAYAYLSERGMPKVGAPFLIGANFRVAGQDLFDESDEKDPLQPYANAFYAPADPTFEFLFDTKKPALFLGQATHIDFAYDGDVVYHEFGHAMVDATAKLDGEWKLDSQGASPAPGAMNEGLADVVSSWIAGDSKVGEYSSEEGGVGETSIRDIKNNRKCPDDIVGEEHQDSLYFSGPLWDTREKAFADPEGRLVFETAVITALNAAPTGNLGMDEFVKLLVTALEEAGVTADKVATLQQAFADRGFTPSCRRVFEWTGSPISSTDDDFYNYFFMPGLPYIKSASAPFAPGIFQIHANLPENTAKIEVDWESYPYSQGGFGQSNLEPQVIVRYGAEAITFQPKGSFNTTAEDPVDANGPKNGFGHFKATLTVPAGQTEAYVMLVNAGDEGALFGDVRLSFVKGATPKPPTGGAGGTAGGNAGNAGTSGGRAGAGGTGTGGATNGLAPPAADAQTLPHPEGGCAIGDQGSASRGRNLGAIGLLLGAVGLVGLRRRRHPS